MSEDTIATNKEDVEIAAIRKPREAKGSTDSGRKRLTVGSGMQKLGMKYGLDDFKAIDIPSGFVDQVEMARTLYEQEGIVRTVIDLMVDFSATGMRNEATSPKTQKFFDTHCRYADMDKVIREVLFEYYMSGDVFTYRGDKMAVRVGPDAGKVYYPYTVLNPTKVEVEGPLLFGGEIITLSIPDELRTVLAEKQRFAKILKDFPAELKSLKLTNEGKLILDQNKVSRISRKKQPYQRRPTPFLTGAFAPILLKRRLREMDLATAEGTINSLMVIKVGNDKYPATKAQLRAISELFATGAKSYQLFWNHTIEIDTIEADLTALGDEKYKQINRDILSALGMPGVLINGGEDGGRFANAWASIVALIERLDNARREVKRWLEREYLKIAEENNIKDVPSVEFERMNLREEKVYMNILTSLYDRGLLDVETTLDETGHDFDRVLGLKEKHEKDMKHFEPPYDKLPQSPTPSKPQSKKKGGEGRPTTEIDTKYTPRDPEIAPKMTDYNIETPLKKGNK